MGLLQTPQTDLWVCVYNCTQDPLHMMPGWCHYPEYFSLWKKIAHFRLPCVCVTNANPISMKLGTVSLWCLCCSREMRYYNFISVVVIFPLKKKSVFLFSWTGPVKPDLFFERSFFRQKSPGSPDGPHKKLSWKYGFVNQFTTSWKAFPPIWFFETNRV